MYNFVPRLVKNMLYTAKKSFGSTYSIQDYNVAILFVLKIKQVYVLLYVVNNYLNLLCLV